MFHAHRRSVGTALATALTLGATVAPGAFAQPADQYPRADRDAAASAPRGTDLRSPDAREPTPLPSRTESPHQTAPPSAKTSAPVIQSADGGFDWGDAALGAGAMLTVLLAAGGGTVIVRRTRRPRVAQASHS